MEPASIRYNNPGAMWGGNPISKKFGATENILLHDGLHENNHIAFFPDRVHGAAAQFALWQQDYRGYTLQHAIYKWSGHNSSPAYLHFLCSQTGLRPTTLINTSVLSSPSGLKLMKAQAHWEAGQVYPMSDEDWAKAQKMVFPESLPPIKPYTAEDSPPIKPTFFQRIKNYFK